MNVSSDLENAKLTFATKRRYQKLDCKVHCSKVEKFVSISSKAISSKHACMHACTYFSLSHLYVKSL